MIVTIKYACKIFEWENNRGSPVPLLDIYKSNILKSLDEEDRCEVYDKWEKCRNMLHHRKVNFIQIMEKN